MPKRMSFTKPGGPAVLAWSEFEAPSPKAHEVVVANRVVGLNFIDCYQRSGLYPLPLPGCPGVEGVGTIARVGAEVEGLAEGERVIYFSARGGAYAEEICLPAANAIRIPESIDDEIAACLVNKGLTAWYLLRRSYPVKPGDTVVVHAAAGGVGLILTQWARLIGARVIGIVGTKAKAELAAAAGAAETILAADDVPADLAAPVYEDLLALRDRVTGGTSGVYADIQEHFDGATDVADAARRIADADRAIFADLYDDAG